MRQSAYIVIVLLATTLMIGSQAHAQTMIECDVVYRYKDQKNAVREQQWEEGWNWIIEGRNSDAITLVQSNATSAKYDATHGVAGSSYIITYENVKDQNHSAQFTMPQPGSGGNVKVKVTIIKYYNKVVLKDKNNQSVSGTIYFAPSGISDFSQLTDTEISLKCPAAANGGYSFPSIRVNGKTEYSIYVPDSKNDFREISFKSKQWYGEVVIADVKIE